MPFDLRKRLLCAFAAGAIAACPLPALARDWPETAGWTIIEGDTYCAMTLEYEGKGETQLAVSHNLDNEIVLIVANYGWSAKKDASYDLDFYLGGKAYGGGTSRGSELDYRMGFATRFDMDFWQDFKAAGSLKIMMGETLVDHLNLSGTAAAGAMVDRCLSHVRSLRNAEERERKRFEHIPDDPFAGAKSEPVPARLPASTSAWITNDDYPAAALRAGEQGIVAVRLDVTTEGRVKACTVTATSGSALLDGTTCSLLQRRARLTPAIGPTGAAVEGSVTHKVRWTLPAQP